MRSFFNHVLGAFALVGALTQAAPASATTLEPLTVEQFTDASTWVIRGTVREVWTDLDAKGDVWTHARVSVTETFKGFDAPAEVIIDQAGGTVGAYSVYVSGSAGFSVDEDILAFLYQVPSNGRVVLVSKYRGKLAIRRAPGDSESYVRRSEARPNDHFDGRFLSHPPAESRTYLADMLDQVRTHLLVGWQGQPISGLSAAELARLNTPDRRIAR